MDKSYCYEKFLIKYYRRFSDYPLHDITYQRWLEDDLSIVCPEHGICKPRVKATLFKKGSTTPCTLCTAASSTTKRKRSYSDFVIASKKIHKDYYTYEECMENFSSDTKINVVCPKHGSFSVLPYKHCNPTIKQGCRFCGYELVGDSNRISTSQYVKNLKECSSGNLSLLGEYKGANKLHKYSCKSCNYIFSRKATYVTNESSSCPNCEVKRGYNKTKDAVIYISDWSGGFIKVGITNRLAIDRFKTQDNKTNLKGELLFESPRLCGSKIFDLELLVADNFNKKLVSREIFPDGFSECYHKEDYESILDFIKLQIS